MEVIGMDKDSYFYKKNLSKSTRFRKSMITFIYNRQFFLSYFNLKYLLFSFDKILDSPGKNF